MPPQLDYEAYFDSKDRQKRKAIGLSCFVAGIVATPITIAFAVFSTGAGHGTYAFFRLFFPYQILLTLLTANTITTPLWILCWVQFPVYGSVMGFAATRGQKPLRMAIIVLGAFHLGAAVACFSGVVPNFS